MAVNDTIANIQFDWAFVHSIKNQDRTDTVEGKGSFKGYANGVPFQHYILFKTICLMPDEKHGLTSKDVATTCTNVFGVGISQPSISRAIQSLKEVGLVEGINNPFASATLAWIKLTNKGRKLQRLFLGSTAEWKDKLRVVSSKDLQELVITEGVVNKKRSN